MCFLRLALLILLTSAGTAFPQAATLPRAEDPLPAILIEWGRAQEQVGDIVVNFHQIRTVPALKQPVHADGRFWRFSDGAFRWEVGQPPAIILVHDSQEFRVRESNNGPWTLLDEKDGRYRMWSQFLSGKDMEPEKLSRNFSVKITGNTPDLVTVTMMPRPLVVRRYLKQIDLQIAPDNKRLRQLRVIQGDGSTVLMQFAEPKVVKPSEKTALLAK